MIGLILAGGKGTRLHPYTEETPKPLIKVNGKAILEHQIELLLPKVDKIVIITGFLREKIEGFVKEKFDTTKITYVHNSEFENSRPAYAIIQALPLLEDAIIYLNGDVFFDIRILEEVINTSNPNTTAIQKVTWDEEEVNVVLDKDNNIQHISKNIPEEKSAGEFIGVTKLGVEFLKKMKEVAEKEGIETFRFSFAIDLINHVIQEYQQTLFGLDVTKLKAIEIDTLKDLNTANIMFNEK